MKHIYVILFAAALSAGIFSCEEKNSAEKSQDRTEGPGFGKDLSRDTTSNVTKAVENEAEKTTKNGSDAH